MKKIFFIISIFLTIISVSGCSKTYVSQNPYEFSTGHYAGYEWAKKNFDSWALEYAETGNVRECSGNSESFIEGCNEYIKQKEEEDKGSTVFTAGLR